MYMYRSVFWQLTHQGYKEQKIHTHTIYVLSVEFFTAAHARTQYKPCNIFVLYSFIKNTTRFCSKS
jgi:hypothetical protein